MPGAENLLVLSGRAVPAVREVSLLLSGQRVSLLSPAGLRNAMSRRSMGPVSLVVVSQQVQLQRCALYAHYQPVLDAHHVCPESWWRAAGVPVASPLLSLCPNCHYSVHAAIDGMIRKLDVSLIAPRCRATAQEAFTLAADAGLTPALTL